MRTYKKAGVGDTVRVRFKIFEEGSERLQTFEGTLIKVRGSQENKSLTVRRITFGVGIERIFPVASPRFMDIEVVRRGRVRRSKLYYMRKLSGKAHRIEFQQSKENNVLQAPTATPIEPSADKVEKEAAPLPTTS